MGCKKMNVACYVFIAVLMIVGLVIGCSNSSLKELSPLEGEWNRVTNADGRTDGYVFKDKTFVGLHDGIEMTKGSCIVNGNEITVTTEMIMPPGERNPESKFFTKDELVRQFEGIENVAGNIHPMALDYFFSTVTYTFSVDGDVLTLKYPTALDELGNGVTLEDYGYEMNRTVTPEWVSMMYQRVKS